MGLFTGIFLFLGFVGVLIYFYYKRQFNYWKKRGVPHATPTFPLGNLDGMLKSKNIGESMDMIYQQFPNEPFVGLWIIFGPALMIRDPELVKNVFVRDFNHFVDRGVYVNEEDDPLAAHLFAIAGTKWRNMRVKMTPTFTTGKIKMLFPIMAECSKRFKEVLNDYADRSETVEMKDFSARFTTDIISLAAFGLEADSLHQPDSLFRQYSEHLFEPTVFELLRNFTSTLLPRLGKFLHLRTLKKDCSDFFLKVFQDSMEYREKNNVRCNDFLDLLIQLKNKGKLEDVDAETPGSGNTTKFTFYEAAAQAFVFFIAGFETSSTTMQFALYELAKNQDVQDKARQEVFQIMKKYNGEITYECVMEMNYLGRVIDETLRIYPPLPFLQRMCTQEYQFPDTKVTLEKGDVVLIDILGMQRDPKHFPNPERFDPNRFLEENKNKRHPYSYLPFGEGPRNCIGMRFGLLQTRVGLLTLLSNYKFEVTNKTLIPMVYETMSLVMAPKGGMYLRISKINP